MDNKLTAFLNEKAIYLEKERKKALRINYIFRILKPIYKLLKVVLIVLAVLNFILPFLLPLLIILAIIFCLLYFLFLVFDPKQLLESKLKEEVLPEIFKSINNTFIYKPYSYNKQILNDSEILSKGFFSNHSEIIGEDYVKGKIENVEVEFFEVKIFKEVTNYLKTAGGCLLSLVLIPVEIFKSIFLGDTQNDELLVGIISDRTMFFSGFFMYADFHKDFDGKVLMIPKNIDRKIDKIYEILDPKTLTKISVENPKINDKYNIYTSNTQTGYYILSQSLIERIDVITEKEKAFPILSFINGKMYLVIPWEKNFFDININVKIEDHNFFTSYIEEIESFEKIVKDLNLDTRIWSKV